ncbi:hypothetical protein SUGI_0545450 [Cryptomeria japonica]|nr:hypothetical protein SUGI_0545450 [Cryptomeria japonica]
MVTGSSFLCDYLGISGIILDRACISHDSTLFLHFQSIADCLCALRAKRKLFTLPTKVYLDEDLTKTQVAELKQSRGLVVEARRIGSLLDALGSSDILLLMERHESPVCPLPSIAGCHWHSAFRSETRSSGGVRGSGGVACLLRDRLRNQISLVSSDVNGRFMWVRF